MSSPPSTKSLSAMSVADERTVFSDSSSVSPSVVVDEQLLMCGGKWEDMASTAAIAAGRLGAPRNRNPGLALGCSLLYREATRQHSRAADPILRPIRLVNGRRTFQFPSTLNPEKKLKLGRVLLLACAVEQLTAHFSPSPPL
eukprot:scaffold5892_cov112-Isochrysis_galbana.AAC.21